MPTYGETIRDARVAKRMTLRGLAAALELTAPHILNVEKDRRLLSPKSEARVCEVLGIDPVVLEAGKGYTRDLADWIKDNPDLIRLLREHRRTGQPLRIGGENCSCRSCR